MAFKEWRQGWQAWAQTREGTRWINLARVLFVLGIVAVLVLQLTEVGWKKVLAELPASPWFYVLWLSLYLVLPVADAFSYRLLWGIPYWKSMPVFFRKRVYGTDVMNYSGEVYVFFWARGQLSVPGRQLAKDIRDNTIVSSITSTLISAVILAGLFLTGQLSIGRFVHTGTLIYIVPGVLIVGIVVGLGIRFRRHLYELPAGTTARLMGIHGARIASTHVMQVAQWAVVLPDIPMQIWFSYLAVQILINAIPVVPSKDLIFLGLGVGIAGPLGAPQAAIAGMLLVKSVMDKIANVALFVYTSIRAPQILPREGGAEMLQMRGEESAELEAPAPKQHSPT